MAQEIQDKKYMGVVDQSRSDDDPMHDATAQVGSLGSAPVFEGASAGEKLPESRVGEALQTDNLQKLEQSSSETPMETEHSLVKSDESFADAVKAGLADQDEGIRSVKSTGSTGSTDEEPKEAEEQPGTTRVRKLNGAGIPRGKPHFRGSANHGSRGLGDEPRTSLQQSGGLGGGNGGSLRGGMSRGGGGGLARTGSGLARTGSGIPQGNSDLSDFAAAMAEVETKSPETSLPLSSDAFPVLGGEQPAASEKETKAKNASVEKPTAAQESPAPDRMTAAKEIVAEKAAAAKDFVGEKASITKETIAEKAGELKTGFMATIKDQLIPTKDPQVKSSKIDVSEA